MKNLRLNKNVHNLFYIHKNYIGKLYSVVINDYKINPENKDKNTLRNQTLKEKSLKEQSQTTVPIPVVYFNHSQRTKR